MKLRFANKSTAALTLFEVLAIMAIVLILAGLFLPALALKYRRSSRIGCASNLKQVALAFSMWSNDNKDKFPFEVSVTNGGTMELVQRGWVFPHFQVMSNEVNDPKVLICPQDTERKYATNFTSDLNDWKISYFVGVDASGLKPSTIIAGDRNLAVGNSRLRHGLANLGSSDLIRWTSATTHSNQGNIALADGSVQQLSSSGLQKYFRDTGLVTNRLVLP